MIQFKAKATTNPGKLASAIAYNIKNADIEVSCAGASAVNSAIKALIIAKKYTQNEEFTLGFDFLSIQEINPETEEEFNTIKVIVSKVEE